jgi:hypothetical protein
VSDIALEAWQKEMENAGATLRKRFPDLRCGAENFLVRMWTDQTVVPGVASDADNRVVEIICESSGLQEKHVVRLLASAEPK